MKFMMEIIYVLMIVIGLAMIVYDVLHSRSRAPVREREMEAKNVFRKKPAR